ncbi:MAG: hypothetical protein ACM3QS_02495 [Bacteroidota bacterium]|jgi:hypothetical protein
MFFLQEPPPNTSGYMIAGYVIFFVVMAIYLASLFIRWRNLDQDLRMLEEMEKEQDRK